MGQCLTYFFPNGETIVQNFNNGPEEQPQDTEAPERRCKLSHFLKIRADNSSRQAECQRSGRSSVGQLLHIIDIEDVSDVEELTSEREDLDACQLKTEGNVGGRVATTSDKTQNESELINQEQKSKNTVSELVSNEAEKLSLQSLASSFTSTSASDDVITGDESENRKAAPFPRPSPWRKLYLKAIKPKEVAATTKKELQLLRERPKSRVDWFVLKRTFNRRPGLSRLRRKRRIVPAQLNRQEINANKHVRKTRVIHVAEAPVQDDHAGIVGGILLLQGIDETSRVCQVDRKESGEDYGYFASGEDE